MKKILCFLLCIILVAGVIPFSVFARNNELKSYTMWGNNLLQANIKENKNKINPDGSANYDIKPIERYRKLLSALKHYSPDIIALQECDIGWHDLIDDNGGYGSANNIETFSDLGYSNALDPKVYDVEGVRNPIYYKSNIFTVESSGIVAYGDPSCKYYEDPWVFTWAILKDKTTGTSFAVSSTHIISNPKGDTPEKAAQIKELIAYMKNLEATKKVPLVMMGDYNCSPDYTVSYPAFEVGEKVLSARDVSKEVTGNQYNTTNSLGSSPGLTSSKSAGVIDHTMISTIGIAPIKYQTLVEVFDTKNSTATYSYSDHVPQLFTFGVVGIDHKHIKTTVQKNDADTHKLSCSECYISLNEEHSFTQKCAELADGSENRVCALCGEISPAHDYKYYSQGSEENASHVCKCANCGKQKLIEAHKWSTVQTPPTYAVPGALVRSCSLCGESVSKSAGSILPVPPSPFELEAGGQHRVYVGEPINDPPTADGVISENEYSYEIKNLNSDTDSSDGRFYIMTEDGKKNDIENVDLYLSYDENMLYLAANVTDSDLCGNGYTDALYIYICTKGKTNELDMFYMPRTVNGAVEAFPYGKDIATPALAEKEAQNYVGAHSISMNGNTITYEITFKLDSLSITDPEKIFFGVMVRSSNGTRTVDSRLFFGFETKGLESIYPSYTGYYPHVLTLGNKPANTTDTVEPANTTDSIESEEKQNEKELKKEGSCASALTPSGAVITGLLALILTFATKKKD